MTEARRRRARRAGIVAAAIAAGVGAAVAAERLIRRERARPDPEAGERLGSLRGKEIGPVRSFDGTTLHVEEIGSGPTLVLAHGFSLDLTTWHYQMRDLSPSYRLVLFDQRGHGRSAMPPSGGLTLEALGRDLHAVIEATSPGEPVVVVGHSMGGMTALECARLFPASFGPRIAGLVLVDTTAADVMEGMLPGSARRIAAALNMVQESAMGMLARPSRVEWVRRNAGDLGYLAVRAMGFGPKPSPSQVAYVERLLSETPTEVWLELTKALLALDVLDVCEAIDVPTLIVVGTHDRLTPAGAAARMAGAIRGAKLARIQDAGHMAMLERPHVFNARLRAFLARVPGFARAPA